MLFRPKYTINTIYNLDPQKLNEMGIKAVFSDLDNTLLAWNKFETAKEMDKLNKRLAKANIKLVVISNNNAQRVGKCSILTTLILFLRHASHCRLQ